MIKTLYNMIDTAIVLFVGIILLTSFRSERATKMSKKKWCRVVGGLNIPIETLPMIR